MTKCCHDNCAQGRNCPERGKRWAAFCENPKVVMTLAILATPFIILWMLIRHPVMCYRIWKNKDV